MDGSSRSTSTDLLESSAFSLAARIRDKRVSSREVVEAHIARIEAVDPCLNAVVNKRFEAARREAALADEAIARGESQGPLHGVPCTIKEFFGVTGMPRTGGMIRTKDEVATEDAVLVRRLRAAGAIVLGCTNVPEGGLWMETYNPVYGRTNNPWDVKRTPGGSSGGEGAIIAAGGSPFGLGSDIGGSIRLPAAFCGIPGHKPTGRMLPNHGSFPTPNGTAQTFLSGGPMARRVSDLMPLLEILAGPDPLDRYAEPMELGRLADVKLEDLTVIPIETNGRERVSETMRREVRRAAAALEARGAKIRTMEFPRLARSLEIWACMLEEGSGGEHYDTIVGGERGIPASEYLKFVFGKSRHSFAPLAVSLVDKILSRIPIDKAKIVAEGFALQAELEAALGDRGVLLIPPFPTPAPVHHGAWRTPVGAQYTAIFNVLELPVTVVPTGFDARGLPLSVQIVGRRKNDHVTLAAAEALEAHFGGWVLATPEAPRARASA
ncbi:MAG: amidase [Polyangiaceae bacterium]